MEGAARRKARDPVVWHDITQLLKTMVAAVTAWVVAETVLDLPQPFLAPWAALLVVHATVYRTFSRGLRQVVAAVVAVLLAASVGQVLGVGTTAVSVLIVVGLLIGSMRWFGAEATTVAATGLVVLTTGSADDARLWSRLLDTGIGVGVGLVVNLAVWPPLLRRTAIASLNRIDDRVGELLEDIGRGLDGGCDAEQVEEWVERTRDIDADLDQAWSLVRQASESARMNLRRSAGQFRDPAEWHGLLHRMEQAVAEIRSMARTLGAPANPREQWEPLFGEAWTALLVAAGRAIADAEAEEIRAVRHRLETLVGELSDAGTTPQWPVQGALVINLRNILDAMDQVALSTPLDEPPRPLDRVRWRAAQRRVDRAVQRGR